MSANIGFDAPNFELYIEGARVPEGVRQRITAVEYESADGMADMARIMAVDERSDNGKYRLIDSKIFQPGNEISLFMGYGPNVGHVGRAIIRRMRPSFPQDGQPTIEAVAYTKDSVLADNSPEGAKPETEEPDAEPPPPRKDPFLRKVATTKLSRPRGRIFANSRYSDAVEEIALDYGFKFDIDPSPDEPHDFIQKAGLSDFDFVQGISNLTGFYWWVDAGADTPWTLHFKDPDEVLPHHFWPEYDDNPRVLTFRYGQGDFSTLLSFEPEIAIQGAITKLKVLVKDILTGKLIEVDLEENNARPPDVLVDSVGEDEFSVKDQELDTSHTTASDVKLFINDYSFDIKANRRFTSTVELAVWARQWFRRNRENFLLSRGAVIGVELLRARQTHKLSGMGVGIDGEYFFSRVRHSFSSDSGYNCEFNARRVVPKVPPVVARPR